MDSSDYQSSDDELLDQFILVEFEDGVQLINKKWMINKTKCYWPNPAYKSNERYFKAVESGESPGKTWKPYSIRILGSFSDWSYARRKLKTAEAASDINTTDNEDIQSRKDRKRKLFNDSGEEEPPRKITKKLPMLPEAPVSSMLNWQKTKSHFCQNLDSSPIMKQTLTKSALPSGSSTPKTTQDLFENDGSSPSSSRCPSESASSSNSDAEWKMMVVKELSTIKLHLRQIFSTIKKSNAGSSEEVYDITLSDNEVLKHFPIRTVDDFGNVEAKIGEEMFKKRMIFLLGRFGGNSTREATKTILKKIMTDDLGSQFSWHGVKGKKALALSPVADVLFEAVRSNRPSKDATDAEIICLIKNWLRHAPERAKPKKNGSQQQNTDDPVEEQSF